MQEKKADKKQLHEFALFTSDVNETFKPGRKIGLEDVPLVRRIQTILRLKVGATFVLFNGTHNVGVKLVSQGQKGTFVEVIAVHKNPEYAPSLTVILPVLKREALEEALYSCVELGVTAVRLVFTAKTARAWNGDREYERLQRIMISAAEQSKNFRLPTLYGPCELQEALMAGKAEVQLFADPTGISLKKIVTDPQKKESYTVVVGPEGDLTLEEKELLKKYSFLFYHLTPTVLRSQQALAVLVGTLRSFL